MATYPLWLQKIAFATPFPAILGERTPSPLAFNASNGLSVLLTLCAWILLGSGLVWFLYQRGLKILNISGG